jgi:TRAP-type C4-dicarboxylate transport system permease small subunit
VLRTLAKSMNRVSVGINRVSAAAVVFIMLLTCADVVMRLFGRPIPGTYELVGYFGAVLVAFAMACTFIERGHISVELLVDRLPARPRAFIEGTGYLLSAVLFGLLAWQSQVYAMDLLESGEVSPTIGIPTWPFVFSLTAGCGMLSLVLFLDGLRQLKKGLAP